MPSKRQHRSAQPPRIERGFEALYWPVSARRGNWPHLETRHPASPSWRTPRGLGGGSRSCGYGPGPDRGIDEQSRKQVGRAAFLWKIAAGRVTRPVVSFAAPYASKAAKRSKVAAPTTSKWKLERGPDDPVLSRRDLGMALGENREGQAAASRRLPRRTRGGREACLPALKVCKLAACPSYD